MVNTVPPAASGAAAPPVTPKPKQPLPRLPAASSPQDILSIGEKGPLPKKQAMGVVLNRAYERLRAVVDGARSELGIPEGAVIDTSPEATANRIADFALGFFDSYAENNGLTNDEEGRAQFAEFIGGAIFQGVQEARDILTALNSLTGEVESGIEETVSVIQTRLDDFVANGL